MSVVRGGTDGNPGSEKGGVVWVNMSTARHTALLFLHVCLLNLHGDR